MANMEFSSFINKTLLITGGTGSFGSQTIEHFKNAGLKEIRVFSRDEKKQEDLRIKFNNDKLNFIIGDVRDFNSINRAMMGVDYVFQAAALKQVPACEFYPMEAIKTNVLGSENVLESAIVNKIKRLVVLSTDKAVYPINTMGMTKALMEKLSISKSRDSRARYNGTIISATRYGNVMCSRGSIIPLFVQQIKQGLPLTITEPDMTRFMMTLHDAINLVVFAFENANPGDLFVQKAPAATIIDLATALKELFSAKNEIIIIGSRHGEKMHETLCGKEEMSKAEDLGSYYRIPADLRDLNYTKYIHEYGKKIVDKEYNSENTKKLSMQELKELLLKNEYIIEELKN
ncbi:UDP-glucose 4-epimerase [Spirochaetia bacterium]|nr:UDP-glucose 4-epimerase [Spirochaetia bacterium]